MISLSPRLRTPDSDKHPFHSDRSIFFSTLAHTISNFYLTVSRPRTIEGNNAGPADMEK